MAFLKRNKLLLILVACLVTAVSFYWYQYNTRAKYEQRAREFGRLIAEFRQLPSRSDLNLSRNSISDPLSYLETKVGDRPISQLSPEGRTDRGSRRYQLRMEGIPPREGLMLLHEIEEERQFIVSEFHLERVGTSEERYDMSFQFILPASEME